MKYPLLLITAAALFAANGCTKTHTDPNDTPFKKITITSISPTHGAGGTSVHIIGTGFNTTIAYDTVKINGLSAVITAATDTSLDVTIPMKAGSGLVTLATGGAKITGPTLTYDTAWFVTTIAGSVKGFADGNGSAAQFNKPNGICVDKDGNMYVADMANYRIRKITKNGTVTTLAGGTYGTADGVGTSAQFQMPSYVAVDLNGFLYISDSYANRVKKYDPATQKVTTIAGGAQSGNVDGPLSYALLYEPNGIFVNPDGNGVYFTDMGNNNIRFISGETISTLAGNTCISGHSDGPRRIATFQTPFGICADSLGNAYVADTYSQAVRKYDISTGMVSTIAGDTVRQGSKDGVGRAAQFFAPASICIARDGTLYVADTQNHEIRQVTQAGVVTTIAGSTTAGNVDGLGSVARFHTPWGINIDSQGALYIADTYNHTIRKMVRQ
ncbi:MAG: IPT/TIG domain-containing protein [Bacteroidetes bacterium]|nr:IPT/TIG domain-containing protein [Bacteroidota bacterium]